jgi:ankyrin repeat protein
MEGNENMSIFLISVLQNLDFKDAKGFTPLHLTVFQSAYKIARHLVMRGASRKAKCNFGQTPFDLAKSRGCTDMFKVLVSGM